MFKRYVRLVENELECFDGRGFEVAKAYRTVNVRSLSFLASVVGRHDDGMPATHQLELTPDRWGSATEGWREKPIVVGIGLF